MSRNKGSKKGRKLYYDKRTLAVYLVLRAIIILGIVLAAIRRDYQSVFYYVLSLILMLLPSIFEHHLGIELPATLKIIILLFIFAAEILGEIESFYVRIPHWDTILHTLNGFLCAAIGFALVDMLNRHEKFSLRLSPVFLAVVAFCFSMTVGVMWEFFEFGSDILLDRDMQKDAIVNSIYTVSLDESMTNKVVAVENIADVIIVHEDGTQRRLGLGGYLDIGIRDTMKDLFVNFIGAVVFSVIGFFYVKARGKSKFAAEFIPKMKETDK